MTISYPLSVPSERHIREVRFRAQSMVGVSASPFTGEQQVYVHQGEFLAIEVSLIPLRRADAEDWTAFFLALNGREGTFLLGDVINTTPQGTWSEFSPHVAGASQTGKTLVVEGVDVGTTALAGDWFQLGTGSSATLHKVTQDATASGSPGQLSLDIWPRLRSSPSNGAAVTISSPKGRWRLASNTSEWTISLGQSYALTFVAVEAL